MSSVYNFRRNHQDPKVLRALTCKRLLVLMRSFGYVKADSGTKKFRVGNARASFCSVPGFVYLHSQNSSCLSLLILHANKSKT